MQGRKSNLLNFPASASDGRAFLKTGDLVPESGIYRVHHSGHRLPHEVTLLQGQRFPRCGKCADAVEFEPIMIAPTMPERRGQIVLYELPVLEIESEHSKSA